MFRGHTVRQYFQPQLFWSYELWEKEKEQVIANILAFIPLGMITGNIWKLKALFVGLSISVSIETMQLITHRGLFEFDDILHNTIGTLIGIIVYIILEKVVKRNITNHEYNSDVHN